MNRSLTVLRRMSVLAPLAVAVAAGAAVTAAAPAAAETGPLAYLSKDTVNGTLPAQVADTAHPLVRIPATAANDVLTAKPGLASVNPSGAASRLGPGTLRTAYGQTRFAGLTARCEEGLDGVVRGFTRIDPDRSLGAALGKVPGRPGRNLRLPAPNGRTVTLNKQVRDATGALTVVGAAVTEADGLTRDYAVARCPGTKRAHKAGGQARAEKGQRRVPEPQREGLLSQRAERSLSDLISMAQLGALPGMQAFDVPGLPGSGQRPEVPLAGGPQALAEKAQQAPSAGAPRPATGTGAKAGKRLAHAPQPGGLLSGDLASTLTGLPGQVAGPGTAGPGAVLGGLPGLPMVG